MENQENQIKSNANEEDDIHDHLETAEKVVNKSVQIILKLIAGIVAIAGASFAGYKYIHKEVSSEKITKPDTIIITKPEKLDTTTESKISIIEPKKEPTSEPKTLPIEPKNGPTIGTKPQTVSLITKPNPFIPNGTYLKSCKNVTVKLTVYTKASSIFKSGKQVLTYDLTKAKTMSDIGNNDGKLVVGTKGNSPINPFVQSPFIPAGSYQQSCTKIKVQIEADVKLASGGFEKSTPITYEFADFEEFKSLKIKDIVIQGGNLALEKH